MNKTQSDCNFRNSISDRHFLLQMSIRPVSISEFDVVVDPEFGQGAPKQVYRILAGQFGPIECHISWSTGQMFGHLPMASLTRRIPNVLMY